jgi:hypothetical protein
MANVITRAGNNAPLTNDQLDGNFTALNSAKLETSAVGTTVLAYDANLQTFVSAFTLPTTDGSAGQIVATDGSGVLSFVDNTSLPSQTGNAGKYLATDGSSAYWADVTGGSGGGGLANVAIDSQEYSATAGQTAFGVNYTDGYVLVYVNGVKLDPSEYTATSNTNITLSEGLALGDTVNLTGFSLTALSDVATSGAYGDLTGAPTAVSAFTNDAGYITGYTETDPVYTASSWYNTTNNASNWDSAYGWGDHGAAGYITDYTVSVDDVTAHQGSLSISKSQISDFGTYLTSETTTSLALSGNTLTYTDETGTANTIDLSAYLDEDSRAIASGTLNSTTGVVTFTRDDATTFTLDLSALLDDTNLVTSVAGKSGVVTLDADDISDSATKGVPTLTKQTNWDSAYGWGDHGAAGYLTSYTETDPVYTASSWYTTTNNATNWDSAYGWGDHSSAGYLTSYTETDPVVGAVTGIVKADGAGNISAAVAGTDYLTSYTETNDLSSAVTWANVPDANITQSSVTQHQAALSITKSQISDFGTYLTSYTETDPVFTAWDKSTGISITESQISDLQSYLTTVALNDVSDVDTATSVPSDGQALLWDATNTKWVPGTVASQSGASTLIQLSDVYTSMSPTDGQVLTYDSTNGWQAEDAPTSSGGGGGGLIFVTKTANYTASSGQGILADTSGGAFTVTLPASPSTGDQVVVADSGNSFATNRLTVARNSSTIADSAEDLVLDINDVLVDFIYDGSTWQFYTQPRAVSSGGSATVEPIVYNLDTVSSALTIDSGENGFSVGNMTISTGGSVTIADGQKWLIADGNITSDVGVPASTGKAIAMSIVFGG